MKNSPYIWKIPAGFGFILMVVSLFNDFSHFSTLREMDTVLSFPMGIIIDTLALVSFLVLLILHPLDYREQPVVHLPRDTFTRRDVDMLNRVLGAEKYEAIAAEYGLAVSTLKNRMRLLFTRIGVQDRTAFLSVYARYSLALEDDDPKRPDKKRSDYLPQGSRNIPVR
jgi:DNA-binding CsgD family transcriptional regulator